MDNYIEGNKAAWEEAFDKRDASWGADIAERISNEEYAFFNCENLQKAALPSSVRHIGEGSFFGSPMLEAQAIPGGVDFIEFDPDKGLISDLE